MAAGALDRAAARAVPPMAQRSQSELVGSASGAAVGTTRWQSSGACFRVERPSRGTRQGPGRIGDALRLRPTPWDMCEAAKASEAVLSAVFGVPAGSEAPSARCVRARVCQAFAACVCFEARDWERRGEPLAAALGR